VLLTTFQMIEINKERLANAGLLQTEPPVIPCVLRCHVERMKNKSQKYNLLCLLHGYMT
jgi:hypothetical protein